jgi:hypothetical protein
MFKINVKYLKEHHTIICEKMKVEMKKKNFKRPYYYNTQGAIPMQVLQTFKI